MLEDGVEAEHIRLKMNMDAVGARNTIRKNRWKLFAGAVWGGAIAGITPEAIRGGVGLLERSWC